MPVDDLIAAQGALAATVAAQPDPAKWGEISRNLMLFEPVVDGAIVPAVPLERLQQGASANVDVLTGSNSDEHTLFFVPNGVAGFIDEQMLTGALAMVGAEPASVIAAYREAKPDATPGELMIAALGDWFFRIPSLRVAEARQANGAETFVYEFCWPSPQFDGQLGACHALEVGFVFDNLDDPLGVPMLGSAPPQQLADEMHGAWVAFAKTGAPGWAPYGSGRTTRRFNETSATVDDPDSALRRVWEGVR